MTMILHLPCYKYILNSVIAQSRSCRVRDDSHRQSHHSSHHAELRREQDLCSRDKGWSRSGIL